MCARKDNEYEAGRQVETRVCRDRGWSSVFRAVYTARVCSAVEGVTRVSTVVRGLVRGVV